MKNYRLLPISNRLLPISKWLLPIHISGVLPLWVYSSEVDADVTQTKGMLQFVDVLYLLAKVDSLTISIVVDADVHTTEWGLVCLDAVEQPFTFLLVFLQHPR